jgi:hypothetical protein
MLHQPEDFGNINHDRQFPLVIDKVALQVRHNGWGKQLSVGPLQMAEVIVSEI